MRLVFHMRLVDHDIAEYLRVVSRRIAAEREQIILLVSRQFLRSTGLSGNLIPRHLRRRTRALGHNAAQSFPKKKRGLLGTGLPHDFAAVVANHGALRV